MQETTSRIEGPYKVIRRIGQNSVEIERTGTRHHTNVVYVANVRRFKPREASLEPAEEKSENADENGEDAFSREQDVSLELQNDVAVRTASVQNDGSLSNDPLQLRRSTRVQKAPERLI